MTRHRTGTRLVAVPLAAAGLLVSGALAAWAHVEVEADPGTVGASNAALTFHVPNEEAPAKTTQVTFVMPADHPLAGVSAQPQNGFTASTTTRHLSTAIPGKDGPVSDVVDQLTFSGGTITGTDEKPFVLHVDRLPAGVATLTFKALQKYDNGTTVSWIEVAADRAAEPEHPAPVLKLTAAGGAAAAAATPATSASPAATVSSTQAPAAAPAATPAASSQSSTSTPVWVAVALAAVLLLVAALVSRGRRAVARAGRGRREADVRGSESQADREDSPASRR